MAQIQVRRSDSPDGDAMAVVISDLFSVTSDPDTARIVAQLPMGREDALKLAAGIRKMFGVALVAPTGNGVL